MKSNRCAVVVLSVSVLLGGMVSSSNANIRVIWRPFRVRPVVVAPWPRVVVPAPIVVAPAPGARATGSIDINVRPGRAKVFVNGQYVGLADDFDGNPTYLVLDVGEHRIMLSMEGFKPLEFDVQVEPARVVTLDVDMTPADAMEAAAAAPAPVPASAPGAGTPPPVAPAATEPVYKLETANTGNLTFDVTPKDAAVYINGTYYGTSADFSRNGNAILLQKGSYRIEIVRPGFKNFSRTITLQQAENQVINTTLEKME